MKTNRLMLAALLALNCIACHESRTAADKPNKHVQTQDVILDSQSGIQNEAPPPPVEISRYTAPKMARSEESKQARIGTVSGYGVADNAVIAPPVADAGKGKIEQNRKLMPKADREDYDHIVDNAFLSVHQQPLSTFSIDVDKASYSNVRRYLQNGTLPPAGAVRIEEMVNYFDYSYPKPSAGNPFSVHTELAACPWSPQHRLLHIGLQGRQTELQNLPAANLVFLIDVSGSMDEPNRLPLVQASLRLLTSQLREQDRVAIVVYAGSAGLVLSSTAGNHKKLIIDAINNLQAGGSTAGGEGIELAYATAQANFVQGGNNRVILATDGDFNVGPSSDDAVVSLIEKKRSSGIYLSVLGYGMGNYQDNKMQQLADKGNGNHFYIDNFNEARKVLLKEFGSTLFTIAKDVKIQIEFNPQKVLGYRLIGYENRVLAAEDFNDDQKDAGELGAGHTVTALYEIIPAGVQDSFTKTIDPLKYQQQKTISTPSEEMATIKLRYKKPDENSSNLMSHIIPDQAATATPSDNFRFSAAVAEFGMLLRNSPYKQQASVQQVISLARGSTGPDTDGYRREFVQLVESAGAIFTARK